MYKVFKFVNEKECLCSLVNEIICILNENIILNGNSVLYVSGGKSPVRLFEELSLKDILWDRVCVGLVDERITLDKDHSNEHLVKTHLLQNFAKKAYFIPCLDKTANLNNTDELVSFATSHYNVADVLVLGMGNDGHTASLFADSFNYNQTLITLNPIVSTYPSSSSFCRLSLSFDAISKAKNVFLFIQGEEKYNVFLKAINDNSYPIYHLLNSKQVTVNVYCVE